MVANATVASAPPSVDSAQTFAYTLCMMRTRTLCADSTLGRTRILGPKSARRLIAQVRISQILAAWLLLCPVLSSEGRDWPQFRGPYFNGSTDEGPLPVRWNKTKNLVWKKALPGPGSSTPAIFEDSIFLTSFDRETHEILAISLERRSGNIRWSITVGFGVDSQDYGRENHMVECSPASDGKRVIFMFGTGDLLAASLDGEVLWRRNLQRDYGRFRINWGYSSSPLLYEERLYVQVLHRDQGFLLCLDPETGKNLWKIDRPNDARAESREAYTTPLPLDWKDNKLILILGGDNLTAHDPATGKEQWRWGELNPSKRGNYRIVASPVAGSGLVFVNAPQMAPLYALQLGDGAPSVAWKFEHPTADVPTPVYYKDRLYLLAGRRKVLTCLNPETGSVVWQTPLEVRSFLRASPLAADGKIYCISAEGEVVVLAAGDEMKVLSRMNMGEYPCRSSIVASQGQLFIRTGENLYCISRS